MPTESKRNVPADALRLEAGRLEFAEQGEDNARETKIKLFARTAEAIRHPYWGKLAHDMSGMRLRKDRAPIDWCHETYFGGDAIGYADKFDADEKDGLTIHGKLVSVRDDDQASSVMARGRAGIPYEASIDFTGPMRLEEVGEGMTAEVNGRTFEGPGVIFREWTLRAVAICPFGADSNTRSKFTDGKQPNEVEVTIFSNSNPEPEMSTEQKPAEGNTETKPAPAPTVQTEPVDVQAIEQRAFAAATRRASEITAVCQLAGCPDKASAFIDNNAATVDSVRKALFEELCANNKPVGGDGGNAAGKQSEEADPDKQFKEEYQRDVTTFRKLGVSMDEYVQSRRLSEGLE